MSRPYFSVVIPTCHRNDLLASCLEQLAPGKQIGMELIWAYLSGTTPTTITSSNDRSTEYTYEVIISDDGTKTTSEEMVQNSFPWAKWVNGPKRGPAANRNNGASHAKGCWLIFTDDDCRPDSDWLLAYSNGILSNSSIKVFEGGVYCSSPQTRLDHEAPLNNMGGYLWSCNFCMTRELFSSMGGFNESFVSAAMEDVELRMRLVKTKEAFVFLKDATVEHPWRGIGNWQSMDKHQAATLQYLKLHPEEATKINSIYYLRIILSDLRYLALLSCRLKTFSGIVSRLKRLLNHLIMSFRLMFFKP